MGDMNKILFPKRSLSWCSYRGLPINQPSVRIDFMRGLHELSYFREDEGFIGFKYTTSVINNFKIKIANKRDGF